MSSQTTSQPGAEDGEISALILRLIDTEQRLLELTQGQVDSVLDPDGRSHLLFRAQEKLRNSEATQRDLANTQISILNALPANIALIDSEGVILSINERWRQFGLTEAVPNPAYPVGHNYIEVCERTWGDHASELHRAATGIRSVLLGKLEKFEMEYVCQLAGEKSWFRMAVTPLAEGEGAVVMHLNITGQKQAENELRWKTAFLEAKVNSSLDGIVVVNQHGEKILVNQRAVELLRLPPHIVEDNRVEPQLDYIAGRAKKPAEFLARARYLYAHPEMTSRDEIEFVDGLILDRYSSAVIGRDGTYYGRIWTYLDITERKHAEARFRLLVDSNVQGVIFWNTKGEISDANDCFLKLTHYTRQDLKAGRINWAKMTPPEYAGADQRALQELATNRVCTPYEKEWIRKDFSRIPILVGAAVFADNPSEGVSFILDLTERKKLEQQLLRTQRMESIGTLAGGIAHDLNNILSPILMSSNLLRRAQTLKAVEDIIPVIEGSARRGADVVRQLLIFGRGTESERMLTQVRHLLKDMAKIVRETFPKNIILKSKLPNDLWPVLGDATQLHQVILNLCVNARDAMPEGGTLTLSALNIELDAEYVRTNSEAQPGKYLKLEVSDTGSGIPPEVLCRIFDPFFTTKPLGKGTGLGLSTVMGIVKSHGGFITVQSEPGKGSKFEVHIPAKADAIVRELDGVVATPVAKQGKGELVLVVDDEARILNATKAVLEAHGYAVLTAADGIEALAVFAKESEKIRIVLTDLLMPVLDGFALVRALNKMNPGVKIIVASGIAADSKWQSKISELEALGVGNVLTKPFQPEVLLNLLHEMLHENA